MEGFQTNCPNCDAETLPDDKFCQDCGILLNGALSKKQDIPYWTLLSDLGKWYDAGATVIKAKLKRFWVISLVLSTLVIAMVMWCWQTKGVKYHVSVNKSEGHGIGSISTRTKHHSTTLTEAPYAMTHASEEAAGDVVKPSKKISFKGSEVLLEDKRKSKNGHEQDLNQKGEMSEIRGKAAVPGDKQIQEYHEQQPTKSQSVTEDKTITLDQSAKKEDEFGQSKDTAVKSKAEQSSEISDTKSHETDVARYTELLANYFSKQESADKWDNSKLEKLPKMPEPLSFKEWITAGKPDF